jgi:hypothetical protein
MIWIGLAMWVLLVVPRISLPLIRSPARDALGVPDVPFDGS